MKRNLLFQFLILMASTSYSQYNPISQILYGDDLYRIGYTISINGLGNRMALIQQGGFPEPTTYAKVYDLIDNVWHQVGENIIITNQVNSPSTIVLNQEGNRFVVGTSHYSAHDFVKVYELVSDEWVQKGNRITSEFSNDKMGEAIDINAIGDVIIFGGNEESYAKIFQFENNEWVQKGQTILGGASGDAFGYSVSINSLGNKIAVTATLDDENGVDAGKLYLYEFVNYEWVTLGDYIYGEEGDKIGIANRPGNSGVNLNLEGNIISVGSYVHTNIENEEVGMVKVYHFLNGSWIQKGQILEGNDENDFFGGTHSINASGDILVIGSFYAPLGEKVVAYSFENDAWVEYGNVTVETGSFFGFSVCVNDEGNTISVGTPDDGGSEPSEARIFEYNGVLNTTNHFFNNSIVLIPNPNNGNFSLKFSESISELQISINDISGKQIYTQKYSDSESININQTLASGLYFVTTSSKDSKTTLKMIVQ